MEVIIFAKKEVQYLDEKLHLIPVADGDEKEIHGRKVTFFDIQSTKAKQFGFCMRLFVCMDRRISSNLMRSIILR